MRAPQNRWQAFLVHLGISSVIFIVLLYFIVFHWYPHPYFAKDGGWQGVRLITGVDLVLGPLLTLIVYKAGKPRLKLDLALIGLVQLVALVWGTFLVYGQRIALVTYANGSFYTLSPEQVEMLGGKALEIAGSSGRIPPYSFVRLPANPQERRNLLYQAMFQGMTPYHFANAHEAYGPRHLAEIAAESVDAEARAANNPEFKSGLTAFLHRHGGTSRDYLFVPAQHRYGRQLLALDKLNGSVIDGLDLPPTPAASMDRKNQPKTQGPSS